MTDTRRAAHTLFVATLGGGVAFFLNVPLAWMLGAMWASVLMSVFAAQPVVPRLFRRVALAVIGCYIGVSIGPGIFALGGRDAWVVFATVAVFTFVATALAAWLVRHLLHTDAQTALLSAVPGGLSLLFALAGDYRGDKTVIGVLQVTRIVMIATLVPLWARLVVDLPPSAVVVASAPALTSAALLALLSAFIIGYAAGAKLKSAQVFLLCPMCLVGVFYAFGGSDMRGAPPPEPLWAAQVALGASIGARLDSTKITIKTGVVGAALAILLLAAAAGAAFLLPQWTDYSFIVILLALAPGGIAEICLTAKLLDLQPAFVALAQIERLLLIVVSIPLAARILNKMR